MWPDLAKFRHFGKILKIFGDSPRVWLVFGKLLNLLLKNQCAFGPIYIVVCGQIWSKHFSHLVTLDKFDNIGGGAKSTSMKLRNFRKASFKRLDSEDKLSESAKKLRRIARPVKKRILKMVSAKVRFVGSSVGMKNSQYSTIVYISYNMPNCIKSQYPW